VLARYFIRRLSYYLDSATDAREYYRPRNLKERFTLMIGKAKP
jgi:hypothetical protein